VADRWPRETGEQILTPHSSDDQRSIVRKWTLMGGGNPTSFHPRGAQRLEHKHNG
jgi:hypothetical protein